MASSKSKRRYHRRERRKARASKWRRQGKSKSNRAGHGGGYVGIQNVIT